MPRTKLASTFPNKVNCFVILRSFSCVLWFKQIEKQRTARSKLRMTKTTSFSTCALGRSCDVSIDWFGLVFSFWVWTPSQNCSYHGAEGSHGRRSELNSLCHSSSKSFSFPKTLGSWNKLFRKVFCAERLDQSLLQMFIRRRAGVDRVRPEVQSVNTWFGPWLNPRGFARGTPRAVGGPQQVLSKVMSMG